MEYLIQGDCLEKMKEIDDASVDLILTDPPYLINYATNYRNDKDHDFCSTIANDDSFDFFTWAKEANRILKDNSALYIFGSWKTEPIFRSIFSNYWKHKNNIIWVKNNRTAGDLKAQYGQQYENIMLYNKGRSVFKEHRYPDVWKFNRVSGKNQLHQDEKPTDLLGRIIKNSTNESDVVLDTFMGSGSTGVAAKNLNRNFIGIELDEKYFNIAKERIENS